MSIYSFTRQKLITHGVQNSTNGRTVLHDKHLFLLFVKLERARRLADFCMIHSGVQEIGSYAKRIGKPYLVLFAFMYIRFSDFTPHVTHSPVQLDDGYLRCIKDYGCVVSQSEVAIGEWALSMYEKYNRPFFRAIYSQSDD